MVFQLFYCTFLKKLGRYWQGYGDDFVLFSFDRKLGSANKTTYIVPASYRSSRVQLFEGVVRLQVVFFLLSQPTIKRTFSRPSLR